MDDINDLHYFAATVAHGGFSAAARATGIEKSRLSRRVATLESRLGVRLLHRTTRSLVLTAAGERFYLHCQSALESVRTAYESLAALQSEPSGTVRISCPLLVAQSYLAHILPGFLREHPKVAVVIDASDREVNLLEERFDIALRSTTNPGDSAGLVSRPVAQVRPILVASPDFLQRWGRPASLERLATLPTLCTLADFVDGQGRWELLRGQETALVRHAPALIANDLRVQLEAAIHGSGIAFLYEPLVSTSIRSGLLEQVLPEWTGLARHLNLTYPSPRGILPAVRSLIDYILAHIPRALEQREFYAEAGPPREESPGT